MSQRLLPMDTVYWIGSFLSWSLRVQPITKKWLLFFLQQKMTLRKWKSKLQMYSYMKIRLKPAWLSWSRFAQKHLHLKRRRRNRQDRLSWKATVIHFMTNKRCQSCGSTTTSNVFGTHLCRRCCQNSAKINAHMITTGEARRLGMSTSELAKIPFHNGPMRSRLRFKIDILQAGRLDTLLPLVCADPLRSGSLMS